MDLCHQWRIENFTDEEIGYVCTNNQYEAELEKEWIEDRMYTYGLTKDNMNKIGNDKINMIARKVVVSKTIFAMSLFKTIGGYRYFTNSGETQSEPPHVHIQKGTTGKKAKIWTYKKNSLDSNKIEIAESGGFSSKTLATFIKNIRNNQYLFLTRYLCEMEKSNASQQDIVELKQYLNANDFPDKTKIQNNKQKKSSKTIISFVPSANWSDNMKDYFNEVSRNVPLLKNSDADLHPKIDDALFFFRQYRKLIPDLELWIDSLGRKHFDYKVQDYTQCTRNDTRLMQEYDVYSKVINNDAELKKAIGFINKSLAKVYSRKAK